MSGPIAAVPPKARFVVGDHTIALRLKNKHLTYLSPGGVRSFARLRMTGKILSFRRKLSGCLWRVKFVI
jgi:hypothetical protein